MFLESAIGYGECDRQQYTLPVRSRCTVLKMLQSFPTLPSVPLDFLEVN